MIFYGISELMLPTLIQTQRYDKKSFHFFLIQFKKGDKLNFYRQSYATFYDCINTIYQFIEPFLDLKKKKMSMRNMEPLNKIKIFSNLP